jgi:hypothetical protein
VVVSLSDDCLFRYGRINAAALVELSPQYGKWGELWRNIAADPDATPMQTTSTGEAGGHQQTEV